jgi:hypothetical protein
MRRHASSLFLKGLDKTWPDAALSDSEKNLLREAIETDLRDLEKNCEEESKFDGLNKTSVALGKLGTGVIVATRGSCSCGATGNCAIYLYVRKKDRYREVLRNGKRIPYGWAFAVVDSKADVPDIVLATNDSAVEQRLTKYQYVDGRFAPQACETLTAKNGDSGPKNWWNPDEVSVHPCETH